MQLTFPILWLLPILGTAALLKSTEQDRHLVLRGLSHVQDVKGWANSSTIVVPAMTTASSVSAGFGVPHGMNFTHTSLLNATTLHSETVSTTQINVETSIVPVDLPATLTSDILAETSASSQSIAFVTISPVFASTEILTGPSITKLTETTITTVTNHVTLTITTPVIVTVEMTPTSTVTEDATTAATTSKAPGVVGMPIHQHTHIHEQEHEHETATPIHEHDHETATPIHEHDHDEDTATTLYDYETITVTHTLVHEHVSGAVANTLAHGEEHTQILVHGTVTVTHTQGNGEDLEPMSTTTSWTTVTTTIPTATPSAGAAGLSPGTTITSTDLTLTTATSGDVSATLVPAQTVSHPNFFNLTSHQLGTAGLPMMAGTGGMKALFVANPTGTFNNGTQTTKVNATSTILSADFHTPTFDTYALNTGSKNQAHWGLIVAFGFTLWMF